MRSFAVRLEEIAAPRRLLAAWRSYRSGKRRRPAVARFELDAERRLLDLSDALLGGEYRHGRYQLLVVHDPKPRLIAVAEAYPELKANESFQHLQARITGLQNTIADRREFYNASVNANNVRIDQFPDLFVARLLNFRPAQLLGFAADEVADVNLKRLFE